MPDDQPVMALPESPDSLTAADVQSIILGFKRELRRPTFLDTFGHLLPRQAEGT